MRRTRTVGQLWLFWLIGVGWVVGWLIGWMGGWLIRRSAGAFVIGSYTAGSRATLSIILTSERHVSASLCGDQVGDGQSDDLFSSHSGDTEGLPAGALCYILGPSSNVV